jgi:putative SOS response-associated peptidase YedK
MCGRYVRKTGAQEIAHAFAAIENGASLSQNFNISPTSDVFVLRSYSDAVRLDVMSWGARPRVGEGCIACCKFDQCQI